MSAATPAPSRPRRWALIALAVLGVGLILAPVIFQMFERAPKGAQMISEFRPFMTEQRLAGFQTYMRQIDAGVTESKTKVASRLTGASSGAAAADFDTRFPTFAGFERKWDGIYDDMSGMLTTIQRNRGNYDAVAALPRFNLFPWFFVVPGVLVLLLALGALARPRGWRRIRWALVVLGIGLVLAPAVFQMFERAPKGATMMDAFKPIETRQRVEKIQRYFGDMTVGQGAMRLELVPALQRSGLDSGQIAARYPAVTKVNAAWVPLLNDMTPMIGAMSDNVDNYQAIAALPPFGLFPWFFVAPGVLVGALALLAGPPRRRPDAAPSATPDLTGSLSQGAS